MHKFLGTLLLATAQGLLAITSSAATVTEDFATNPLSRQWLLRGDSSLFSWNSSRQNLAVTWDSSRSNSYFCLPLETTLTAQDDFSLSFDLQLTQALAGIDPQKPNPFQLAVGLINLGQATSPEFIRGSGYESPNLVELSYFPDPGGTWMWGSSLTATMIDWTGTNWSSGGFAGLELATNDVFRFTLSFTPADRTLRTTITRNGEPFGPMQHSLLSEGFLGFELDHLAICSYSDAGQDPFYSGSIFAQGFVDNIVVTTPSPVLSPAGPPIAGVWQGHCLSRTNHFYVLERTLDFQEWDTASAPIAGTGGIVTVTDPQAPTGKAFYRVRQSR